IVIAATKFTHGAWIVVIVIPMLVVTFLAMHRHYEEVAEALTLEGLEGPPEFQHTVLVLVGDVHRGVVRAVQYARTLAPNATWRAVYVETDPGRTAKLEEKWGAWGLGVPLVVLTSPYRSLLRPLLDYIDHIQARGDDQMVTIVVPEFLPRRWWQHVLHNQTALLVKGALLFRKNTVVADVPYLLKLCPPARSLNSLRRFSASAHHVLPGGRPRAAPLTSNSAVSRGRSSGMSRAQFPVPSDQVGRSRGSEDGRAARCRLPDRSSRVARRRADPCAHTLAPADGSPASRAPGRQAPSRALRLRRERARCDDHRRRSRQQPLIRAPAGVHAMLAKSTKAHALNERGIAAVMALIVILGLSVVVSAFL